MRGFVVRDRISFWKDCKLKHNPEGWSRSLIEMRIPPYCILRRRRTEYECAAGKAMRMNVTYAHRSNVMKKNPLCNERTIDHLQSRVVYLSVGPIRRFLNSQPCPLILVSLVANLATGMRPG